MDGAEGMPRIAVRPWRRSVPFVLRLEEGQGKRLTCDGETIKASDAVVPGAKPTSEAG